MLWQHWMPAILTLLESGLTPSVREILYIDVGGKGQADKERERTNDSDEGVG